MVLGEIFGPDLLILLLLVGLLFGGARLPKLARALGSAKAEFEKGLRDGDDPPEQVTVDRAQYEAFRAKREQRDGERRDSSQ